MGKYPVEHSVAYDPFELFWGNPDEPKHSRLIWYFINPGAEHDCGLYLLGTFLSALEIIGVELRVDGNCRVTREDECIDLLITRDAVDGKYAIIIENKVNGARDQKKQLQTYYDVVRKRGFDVNQIFVCYLTLRGGSPSDDSLGRISRAHLTERTFKHNVVAWLEGVLRDGGNWPVKMTAEMCDNLKHYLSLIKWRLNKEKIMQMNEKIFEVLQLADEENRLPTPTEITALTESAKVLADCYQRLKRAKTISAVQRLLQDRYRLRQTHAFRDTWYETSEWSDDLYSVECFFGFSLGGIVIVALGEDKFGGIFTGYSAMPQTNVKQSEQFAELARRENGLFFAGKSGDNWFSYEYQKIDGTCPEHVALLADKVVLMYRKMDALVTKFQASC